MNPLAMLMNPQFWNSPVGGALTSFGLPMLSQLFGAGRSQNDWYKELLKLQRGEGLNEEFGKHMQFLERASSPDRANILADSNAMQNSLQAAYARSGQSGLGATAATLGGMVAGNEFRRLNAGNRMKSYDMANTGMAQKFNQLAAMGPRPTPGFDAFAVGANDFSAFLNDYFQRNRSRPAAGGYGTYTPRGQLPNGTNPRLPRY